MRALALLAAAAMVVSLFLPWLNLGQIGTGFVPWDLIKNLDPNTETLQRFASDSPVELLVFLSTFVLAALFLVLAILGAASRLLAILAGGAAAALVGYTVLKVRDGALDLGVPLPPGTDMADLADQASRIMGLGAWAWGGGALVLLLAGLVGFRRAA